MSVRPPFCRSSPPRCRPPSLPRSPLARYAGRTHALYAYQLQAWFAWCEGSGLDPLVGIQRAHVELYIRQLGDAG